MRAIFSEATGDFLRHRVKTSKKTSWALNSLLILEFLERGELQIYNGYDYLARSSFQGFGK